MFSVSTSTNAPNRTLATQPRSAKTLPAPSPACARRPTWATRSRAAASREASASTTETARRLRHAEKDVASILASAIADKMLYVPSLTIR